MQEFGLLVASWEVQGNGNLGEQLILVHVSYIRDIVLL